MAPYKRNLSFANVTSVLALVVALGGTSYAAVHLPKNSVGTRQIKDNAVRSAEVRNGSLRLTDVKKSERAKLKGPAGTARAYGVFRSTGTLVAARSKNVAVTKIPATTGQYCVKPSAGSEINPARTTIVATPDVTDGAGRSHLVQVVQATESSADLCPNGFRLRTRNFNDGLDDYVDTDIAVSFVIP
jgi:hypothetical protein